MTPSEFEQLKFIQQLLSDLMPMFIAIFLFGIITGVFFFADLINRLDRLSSRLRYSRRITVHDQINDVYCYVYRFKGKYYSESEFNRRCAIARHKSFHKKDLSI
ncbi:hypothetical protein [Acinetobacter bereziniae]|uniref:hypothetical protein n=1 Tax=Acinetobacter bereziniae TaxID=106648 RepID=UPI0012508C62|nr:hypothetical protein [Acinetobacter bereziniae]MBJ9909524.1 hypothetical protein [Acinetobacter bereziniae]MBJ9931228.1 hypothetical protein [Acinetobacter bereziniae]